MSDVDEMGMQRLGALVIGWLLVFAIGWLAFAQDANLQHVAYPPEIAPYLEPCDTGTQYATRNPVTRKYRELRCP